MRKYILVVLIFILSACSLGQKRASQSAIAPTSAATNVPTEVSIVQRTATDRQARCEICANECASANKRTDTGGAICISRDPDRWIDP